MEEGMTRMKWPETITGVVIGLGIGVALGVLFAPKSGDETRDYLVGTAKDRLKDATGRLTETFNTGRQFVRQAQDTVQQAKGQLREQIDDIVGEGERAYREAKNAG
jgi:gas vesicle protein